MTERKPPVKHGEVLELEIIAKGDKGDGIAKVQGYCVFVANADIGEKVKVEVYKVLPRLAFARLVNGG